MVHVYIGDHKMNCSVGETQVIRLLKKKKIVGPDDGLHNLPNNVHSLRPKLPDGIFILTIAGTGQYEIVGLPGQRASRVSKTGFCWNDETFRQAVKWHLDGLNAREVAEKIGGGVTRNAVIGKFSRNDDFIERARAGRFIPAPIEVKPEPEIVVDVDPLGDTCRVRGCQKAPLKYYAHGFCLEHNRKRLNKTRERNTAFVSEPTAGYMG